jgi:hypothetical protein
VASETRGSVKCAEEANLLIDREGLLPHTFVLAALSLY